MKHTDTSPSKPIHTLSPCRTAQEVAESSKIMANQKILAQKVKELEFRLQQANYQNDRLQEQYERATYDQGQLSHNLEDAANNISKLNAKLEEKDKRIHVLLKENEKVLKIVEKKESASRIEQRASVGKDVQHKQQASKEDHINDATLGILAKKRREELDLMTQMNTQNQLKIQNLQNKINQLIEENAQLQKVIKGNNNRGDDLKQIIHNLEATHQNQLRQQSESHKQRINQLQQQHQQEILLLQDEMQRKKKDLSTKVDKRFEETTYPFVQELKDAKNTIENQQKEITRLRIQQYKSHQGNADDLTLQFEKLNKKNSELSDQLFQLQQKSQKDELKLKTKIANLEKANEQLQQIHNHNQHQIDDLQQQAAYMPQYKDKTVENVKLQLDNTKVSCEAENQIKKLKDKIHQLNTELNEKQHKIDEFEDQVRQLTFEKDNAIQNTRLECAQDIKTLQDRMKDEMNQQANMYNQAQKPFQDQLKQAALENQKQKQTIHRQAQEIGNMENKLTELLGNQEEMQRAIQKEKAYQDYLNTEKQKFKDKFSQLEKESEKDQEKINKLQQKLQKEQSEKKESQLIVDSLRIELKKVTQQLEIVGEKNDDLNNKLDQYKQESRVLKSQLLDCSRSESSLKGGKNNSELQMNINNLLTTQIPPVGQWLNNIKQGGDFYAQNELGKQPRLKYINVFKIENLQFPPELDTYKTSFKLRFAATIYDTRNEIFISNTYQSPFLPLFVNDIINLEDMEDDDDQSHSMKSNKQIKSALQNKNTGNYSHAGFWVAFIINKETYLKDYKLAIEITLHQYDNLEKKMEGSKTLGYTLIDLETKLKTSDLYGGSVREINQGYYLREQKLLPQYLSYEWKKSSKVTDLILRLIGPFMLFGMEDLVIGLKGDKLPMSLKDMINLEFDVGLDIKFTSMQFKINKIVEFDLRQYLIEQQIELTKIREVKATRLNQFGVLVCHNGWKAINQSEYENTFKMTQVDKENDQKFDYFDVTKQLRLDRIFNNTVALFQLYFVIEIEVAEIKQDPITYNIGYAVISPKSCNKYTGKLTINILTGPPVFSEKNNLQYYCKHQTKTIGEIEVIFMCPQLSGIDNPMVDKTKDDQETIQMKNQIIQMQKGNDSGNSLKDRLINQSIKKKLQIKTGLAKTETQQRQNKLINDIQEIKQNTSTIVLDMIDKGFKAQHNVQSLLYDFSGLLEVGEQNFSLAKEKYVYQERKLLEYQDRKQKLDQIEISQSMIQQQNYNKWQYTKLIPQNLELIYVSTYKEYLNQIKFGVRDVQSHRQQQITKEDPKGRDNLKISVQFHTYKTILKQWANQPRDDYILPSIYQFDNTCPTQLDLRVHILGSEIKIENVLEQVSSLKQYEICMKNKFYFKKQTIAELVIEKRSLVDERVIIEIWDSDSKIRIGSSFMPLYQNILIGNENTILCNQTKECDILGKNGISVIGLMDVSVLVQYTDIELADQKKKNQKTTLISTKVEYVQEDFNQIYVPPNNYHDVIRLYYGSEKEHKLTFYNPLLYEFQYLGQMKHYQLKGHSRVKLLYYQEEMITILVDVEPKCEIVVYLEIQDEKKIIQRFYKIIISNCESILYNYPVGNVKILEIDYQSSLTDKIKVKSQNPYLANCNDQNMPIIQNSLFRIPIRCVSMEQENMDILVTIQQRLLCKQIIVKFKPIERKVSQLFELRCYKNKSQQETIMYRNKSDCQQLVELSSSNPIMKIENTVLQLLPYESQKIKFLLEAYNSTKKQTIKLFINDAIHSYNDCLLFKLSYI